MGKSTINGSFSMAMLNNQRVNGKPVGARNWVKPDQFQFSRSFFWSVHFLQARVAIDVWWCLYVNSRIPAWNDSDSSGCVFSCESPFCAPYLNSISMSFDFVSYNLPRARTRNIKLIQTHSNLCIYIYTPLYIYILYQLYTYSPNPFGKNNYTRLHPLTLCPGVGFLWLLHQQSAGEDAGYAGNTWWCRPPKMGSMHEKKQNTYPNYPKLLFAKILQLCPDLSPLCEASVGIRKHQCHGSRPKTIHSFPQFTTWKSQTQAPDISSDICSYI